MIPEPTLPGAVGYMLRSGGSVFNTPSAWGGWGVVLALIFVLDQGHGGRAARANLSNPDRLAQFNTRLADGEMTQAEYDAMFDLAGSSLNNANGAISNTLEKTMTHTLIPQVRDRIEARAAGIVEKDPNLEAIEVHLTKNDEFTNLSGRDRACCTRSCR